MTTEVESFTVLHGAVRGAGGSKGGILDSLHLGLSLLQLLLSLLLGFLCCLQVSR
jgi:hypothetical protein